MNYGLYLSASGVLTNMHRQDVLANNLANMHTVGFKPDFAISRQRDAARIEDDLPFAPSNDMIERLGGGVLISPTRTSFSQGGLDVTDNPLDFAIEGEGFFVTRSRFGEGDQRFRLTRDGRFTIGANGTLARIVDGAPVLDVRNNPVTLDPTLPVTIDARGVVRQGEAEAGQLRIVRPADQRAIVKDGTNSFRFRGDDTRLVAATGFVRQGTVERSGVDPLKTLMSITKAGGAVASNARMIELHDQALTRAIGTLGRVT